MYIYIHIVIGSAPADPSNLQAAAPPRLLSRPPQVGSRKWSQHKVGQKGWSTAVLCRKLGMSGHAQCSYWVNPVTYERLWLQGSDPSRPQT